MLRAGVRTVKVDPRRVGVLALVLSATLAGCFSWRYPALLEMHLEVLGSYAAKLDALAQDDHTVPAQDWGEFTYPFERASAFARLGEARFPERPSLQAFRRALDAYGALVADPAILSGDDAQTAVAAHVAAFREAAAQSRAALQRERTD